MKDGQTSTDGEVFIISEPFNLQMIKIPEGEFKMGGGGSTRWGGQIINNPRREVYLPEFLIGKYPVTNLQYAKFVEDSGYHAPKHWENGNVPQGQELFPVTNVNWWAANAFCEWLSNETGKSFRLPTDEEWEKAARGTDGRTYPWGNRFDTSYTNTIESGIQELTPVNKYFPWGKSFYGCLDMVGNASEWVFDEIEFEDQQEFVNYHIIRGAGYRSKSYYAKCTTRGFSEKRNQSYGIGFRAAADLENDW